MYLGRDMDPADPSESNGYTLDFINDIPEGQTIVTVQSVSLSLKNGVGTDTNPSSHLAGSAIILDDTRAWQLIRGLEAGNTYTLQMIGITSEGLVVSIWTHIPCEEVL